MSREIVIRFIAYAAIPLTLLSVATQPADRAAGASRDDGGADPLPLAAPSAPAAYRPAFSLRTTTAQEPASIGRHVVQPGETLFAIAEKFGLRPETVAYNNGLAHAGAIEPGRELQIPPLDGAIYTVREGDTVEVVVARFGADLVKVMELNRLYFEPQRFAPGQTVLVPVPEARFPDYTLLAPPTPTAAAAQPPPGPRATTIARATTQPQPVYTSTGRLQRPVNGIISQGFSRYHTGVDISAPYGTAIGASDAGIVSATGWVSIGGLRVCVQHSWGMETCYYHTSAVYVRVGQAVAAGQAIAAIGLTGVTTGPHVHWEAKLNGVLVNPLAY